MEISNVITTKVNRWDMCLISHLKANNSPDPSSHFTRVSAKDFVLGFEEWNLNPEPTVR